MFGFKKKERRKSDSIQEPKTTNVVSKKVHVSGYIFRDDEQLVSENRVLSPKGDGWLLITSIGVFFILDSEGVYMNLKHEMIESFVVQNSNKISVSWKEESGNFDYQFRVKEGEQEAKRIVNLANETFHYRGTSVQQIELSESDIEQTKKDYIDRFQKMIESNQQTITELEPKFDEIKNEDPDRQKKRLDTITEINKSRENIRVYQKNIEYVDAMSITRSYKIPESIPNGNVWNDCYYDESRKAFVTFDKHYEENPRARTREIQLKFDSEIGANAGIIISEEKTTFRYGYPVIASTNQDGKHVWGILCTLTDDMLTEEIIMARLKSRKDKTDDESAIYDTTSEQWVGGDLKMCEKEYEIGHKNKVWRCVLPLEEQRKWLEMANQN